MLAASRLERDLLRAGLTDFAGLDAGQIRSKLESIARKPNADVALISALDAALAVAGDGWIASPAQLKALAYSGVRRNQKFDHANRDVAGKNPRGSNVGFVDQARIREKLGGAPQISAEEKHEIEEIIQFGGSDPIGLFETGRSLEGHAMHLEILENLGLGKKTYVNLKWDGVSPGRSVLETKLWQRLTHPILDTREIQTRRAAVDELIDSGRLEKLSEFCRNADQWGQIKGESGYNPFTIAGGNLPLWPDGWYRRGENPDPKNHIARETIPQAVENFETVVCTDLPRLREILRGVESPRLRQLQWIVESAGAELESLARKLPAARKRGMTSQLELIRGVYADEKKRDALIRLQGAFHELTFYAFVAEHSERSGWKGTAEAVDRPEPELAIANARPMIENPKELVPFSLTMNGGELIILHGPNNVGKTTTEQTLVTSMLWAQLGGRVPAEDMRYTPMEICWLKLPEQHALGDLGHFGLTAEAAMKEANHVVKTAKDRFVFSVQDEPFAGASPDVLCAAEAAVLTDYLARLDALGKKVVTVVTTHQSTPQMLEHPAIRVLHMNEHHQLEAGMQNDPGAIARAAERAMKKAGASDEVVALFTVFLDKARA